MVLFLMLPIIELYIIVQVAGSMGVLNTIGLLIVVSVVGAWLVRRQGLGVLGRVQAQLAEGRLPGKELVDGLLILFAGALMLTPGFLTDALGLSLLLPPTRVLIRTVLMRRFRGRVVLGSGSSGGPFGRSRWVSYDVTDDGGDRPDDGPTDPPPPIELGP